MKKYLLIVGLWLVTLGSSLPLASAQAEAMFLFHPDARIQAEVRVVDEEERVYLSFSESGTCKFVYATSQSNDLEPWPTPEMVSNNSWGEQDCLTGAWEIKPAEWRGSNFPSRGDQVTVVWLLIRTNSTDWSQAEIVNVSPLFGVSDGYFGLVLTTTSLLNSIKSAEIATLAAEQEVTVSGHDGEYYLVTTLQGSDQLTGFVEMASLEIARASSLTTRQYSDRCVAQPSQGQAVRGFGYTHELVFNLEAPILYNIYFNSEVVIVGNGEAAQLVTTEPLTFEIGGGWIARNLVSDPKWHDLPQWQLVWP